MSIDDTVDEGRRNFLKGVGAVIGLGIAAYVGLAPAEAEAKNGKKAKVVQVNDDNYQNEVYQSKGKTIVLFKSDWDPESPKVANIWESLKQTYGDKVKFCEYKLPQDKYDWRQDKSLAKNWKELIKKYDVDKVPTFAYYLNGKNNGEGINGVPGHKSTEQQYLEKIISWIESH